MRAQDLETLSKDSAQWVMAGRTYDLQRHSPLKQVTTANVGKLRVAWTFSTGVLRGHEGNPLVVGHVMYVHTPFPNKVYALDLTKPGTPQIWQFSPEQPADVIPIACCDVVNRGLAFDPKTDRVFIELLSGDVLALDAKTGKQAWRVRSANYKIGETMTNAPIVIGNVLITGISGGEYGIHGRVTAFSTVDGKELWRTYTTGPDSIVGITANTLKSPYPSDNGKDLGVSTWQGDQWEHGGGGTWGWYSYDPTLSPRPRVVFAPIDGRERIRRKRVRRPDEVQRLHAVEAQKSDAPRRTSPLPRGVGVHVPVIAGGCCAECAGRPRWPQQHSPDVFGHRSTRKKGRQSARPGPLPSLALIVSRPQAAFFPDCCQLT